jgi:hypothetical protein
MQADDITELIGRNEKINKAENDGDVKELGKYVASELAFQRRGGTIVNRDTFLNPNAGDRKIEIESVHVYGNRAVVTCVVTASGLVTHNIRLFVKEGGEWRVLGWANEPVEPKLPASAPQGG